jgi:hypothetical protein
MERDMSQQRGDDGYDAVVVGGRVAGASTALLLARAGHRVAVLDRVRFPSDTLSTHLIWPSGVIQLQRWGLLEAIEAAGTPMLSMIRNDVDGIRFDVPVWAESGVDAVCAPRRTVLDPTILAAAEGAGADVFEGVTVDGSAGTGAGASAGWSGTATTAGRCTSPPAWWWARTAGAPASHGTRAPPPATSARRATPSTMPTGRGSRTAVPSSGSTPAG